MEGVYVSDMEIRRGGRSYTVDTLRELAGDDRRLFLLCGTDMMLTLDEWREPEEIFKLCYPVYIRREKDPLLDARIVQKIAEYQEKYGKVVRRIVTDPITVSSTDIRARIQNGKTVSDLIPSLVETYINDNHLYV
jgi:nicotinate-nucleotide adenylyltransferase